VSFTESFIIGAALYAWNGDCRRIRAAMRTRAFDACLRFFSAHGIDLDATRDFGGPDE
jgi:hypothetical protein